MILFFDSSIFKLQSKRSTSKTYIEEARSPRQQNSGMQRAVPLGIVARIAAAAVFFVALLLGSATAQKVPGTKGPVDNFEKNSQKLSLHFAKVVCYLMGQ